MNVPVDDRDARGARGARGGGRDRDVVEQAEAHRADRASRGGRAGARPRCLATARRSSRAVASSHGRAGGRARGVPRARREVGVGDRASRSCPGRCARGRRGSRRRARARARRRSPAASSTCVPRCAMPAATQRIAHRLGARGPLGMARRRAVLDEDLVEDVAEHASRVPTVGGAREQRVDRVAHRHALVNDRVHRVDDRRVDAELGGELLGDLRRLHALGDLASSRRGCRPSSCPGRARGRRGGCATRRPSRSSTRSPMPDRPANVSGFAPIATPIRVISARPRVISATRVFEPKPRPSETPAPIAIDVLERAADQHADHVVGAVDAEVQRASALPARARSSSRRGRRARSPPASPAAISVANVGPDRYVARSAIRSGKISRVHAIDRVAACRLRGPCSR